MSIRKQIVGLFLVLVMVLSLSCAPKAAPAPTTQVPAPAPVAAPALVKPAAPIAPTKPAWQDEWERTLEAAKKEGSVAITSDAGTTIRAALVKIANMKGIKAEVLAIRGAVLLPKFTAERRAGLYFYDITMTGTYPLVAILKPAGLLERLDSVLILPDLTNPELIKKIWYQGDLPWSDKDHTVLYFSSQPRLAIAINTNIVKEGEIKSWRDILNPKWKGKLAFNDPTIPSTGQMTVFTMVGIMGKDYVKELAASNPLIMRDERQILDWLAFGKVAVVLAPAQEVLIDLIKAGAPIKGISPAEGTWLSASTANLAMLTRPPHPNAAKIFINTLATKEAQEIFAIAGGYQSPRLDVTTSHLPPELMRVEGAKYYDTTKEEALLTRPATNKLAEELFLPLIQK